MNCVQAVMGILNGILSDCVHVHRGRDHERGKTRRDEATMHSGHHHLHQHRAYLRPMSESSGSEKKS